MTGSKGIWMAACGALGIGSGSVALATTNDGTGEDVITEIVAEGTSFEGARLHLPSSGVAIDSGGILIEGLLVGFDGDFIPFAYGDNEITFSEFGDCLESVTLVLTGAADGVEISDMQLHSACRQVLSWADPVITPVDGALRYYRIELTEPETRDIEGALVLPAMAGTLAHVRVTFESEPPGSEIWVNDELLDFRTNIRLSMPYMEDGEDEKRYLIRQDQLVNCYGIIKVPAIEATAKCFHRDVR